LNSTAGNLSHAGKRSHQPAPGFSRTRINSIVFNDACIGNIKINNGRYEINQAPLLKIRRITSPAIIHALPIPDPK
jgi:hypothetical protein